MIRRIVTLIAFVYVLGFVAFMLMLPREAPDRTTDAIVVLTGAAGRIDRALDLLRAHKAQRLLVSGVGRGTGPKALAHTYKADPRLFACCIDLGRQAVDTRSNAEETAEWLARHHYRSVRLVTSDWHMARARLELQKELPAGVTLVPDAVPSSPSLGLLIAEYNKLLVRWIALSLRR